MGIRIDRLAVAYDQQRVIDELSLAIEPGTFFTLLGPSGCGKTTLLRTIAGFVRAAAGRIHFGELDVTDMPAHRRDIGMVFQDYALFPDRSVFENVAYGLRARRTGQSEIHTRVGEALERVGLVALGDRLPAALSGGQRQRVALARALVISPRVLLMDEPLSNLDAKLRLQVRQTIAELQAEAGITTVFVTHDQDEALALSNRIGVMNRGRLEQVGTPAQIYREPASAYVADFVGAANLIEVMLNDTAAAGSHATVMLAGAHLQVIARQSLARGPATLIARPEDIALDAPRAGALNGRVTMRQYVGARTSYRVALTPDISLRVDAHGVGHDRHSPGTEVSLTLDLAGACLLPAAHQASPAAPPPR